MVSKKLQKVMKCIRITLYVWRIIFGEFVEYICTNSTYVEFAEYIICKIRMKYNICTKCLIEEISKAIYANPIKSLKQIYVMICSYYYFSS